MATTRKSAAQFGEEAREMSYKIWLAGVGAYSKAFADAKNGMEQANETATEMFDDLVSRGEAIETEVRDRISSNEQLSKSRERMTQFIDAATDFQDKQKERFEARMERMRSALGLQTPEDHFKALQAQVESLTKQVSELKAGSEKKKPVATKASTAAPAKKAAPRKTVAKASPAKKAAPKKTTTRAKKAS